MSWLFGAKRSAVPPTIPEEDNLSPLTASGGPGPINFLAGTTRPHASQATSKVSPGDPAALARPVPPLLSLSSIRHTPLAATFPAPAPAPATPTPANPTRVAATGEGTGGTPVASARPSAPPLFRRTGSAAFDSSSLHEGSTGTGGTGGAGAKQGAAVSLLSGLTVLGGAVVPRVKRGSALAATSVDDAVIAVRKGIPALKCGKFGKPHHTSLYISETLELRYTRKRGRHEKIIPGASVLYIEQGLRAAQLSTYGIHARLETSCTVAYGPKMGSEKLLGLVFMEEEDCSLFVQGLTALATEARAAAARRFQGRASSHGHSVHSDQLSMGLRSLGPRGSLVDQTSNSARSWQDDVSSVGEPSSHYEDLEGQHTPGSVASTAPPHRGGSSMAGGYVDTVQGKGSGGGDSRRSSDRQSGHVPGLHGGPGMAPGFGGAGAGAAGSAAVTPSALVDKPGDALLWGGTGPGMAALAPTADGRRHPLAAPPSPALVPHTSRLDVQKMFLGPSHAALVTSKGQLYTWGAGKSGQLGLGLPSDFAAPSRVQMFASLAVAEASLGPSHTAAVTATGELYTWGSNASGELGAASTAARQLLPILVTFPSPGLRVAHVACGAHCTAAVTTCGQLFTWGQDFKGILGHGRMMSRSSGKEVSLSLSRPRKVAALEPFFVLQVSVGPLHAACVARSRHPDQGGGSAAPSQPSSARGGARPSHGSLALGRPPPPPPPPPPPVPHPGPSRPPAVRPPPARKSSNNPFLKSDSEVSMMSSGVSGASEDEGAAAMDDDDDDDRSSSDSDRLREIGRRESFTRGVKRPAPGPSPAPFPRPPPGSGPASPALPPFRPAPSQPSSWQSFSGPSSAPSLPQPSPFSTHPAAYFGSPPPPPPSPPAPSAPTAAAAAEWDQLQRFLGARVRMPPTLTLQWGMPGRLEHQQSSAPGRDRTPLDLPLHGPLEDGPSAARRPASSLGLDDETEAPDTADTPPAAYPGVEAALEGMRGAEEDAWLDALELGLPTVFTWGSGERGCLGLGDREERFTPRAVGGDLTGCAVRKVVCGQFFTACITAAGELFTWGAMDLGDARKTPAYTAPVRALGGDLKNRQVRDVCCGTAHLALLVDPGQGGQPADRRPSVSGAPLLCLMTFGRGLEGQLGHGSPASLPEPKVVTALLGMRILQISAAGHSTAAVVEHVRRADDRTSAMAAVPGAAGSSSLGGMNGGRPARAGSGVPSLSGSAEGPMLQRSAVMQVYQSYDAVAAAHPKRSLASRLLGVGGEDRGLSRVSADSMGGASNKGAAPLNKTLSLSTSVLVHEGTRSGGLISKRSLLGLQPAPSMQSPGEQPGFFDASPARPGYDGSPLTGPASHVGSHVGLSVSPEIESAAARDPLGESVSPPQGALLPKPTPRKARTARDLTADAEPPAHVSAAKATPHRPVFSRAHAAHRRVMSAVPDGWAEGAGLDLTATTTATATARRGTNTSHAGASPSASAAAQPAGGAGGVPNPEGKPYLALPATPGSLTGARASLAAAVRGGRASMDTQPVPSIRRPSLGMPIVVQAAEARKLHFEDPAVASVAAASSGLSFSGPSAPNLAAPPSTRKDLQLQAAKAENDQLRLELDRMRAAMVVTSSTSGARSSSSQGGSPANGPVAVPAPVPGLIKPPRTVSFAEAAPLVREGVEEESSGDDFFDQLLADDGDEPGPALAPAPIPSLTVQPPPYATTPVVSPSALPFIAASFPSALPPKPKPFAGRAPSNPMSPGRPHSAASSFTRGEGLSSAGTNPFDDDGLSDATFGDAASVVIKSTRHSEGVSYMDWMDEDEMDPWSGQDETPSAPMSAGPTRRNSQGAPPFPYPPDRLSQGAPPLSQASTPSQRGASQSPALPPSAHLPAPALATIPSAGGGVTVVLPPPTRSLSMSPTSSRRFLEVQMESIPEVPGEDDGAAEEPEAAQEATFAMADPGTPFPGPVPAALIVPPEAPEPADPAPLAAPPPPFSPWAPATARKGGNPFDEDPVVDVWWGAVQATERGPVSVNAVNAALGEEAVAASLADPFAPVTLWPADAADPFAPLAAPPRYATGNPFDSPVRDDLDISLPEVDPFHLLANPEADVGLPRAPLPPPLAPPSAPLPSPQAHTPAAATSARSLTAAATDDDDELPVSWSAYRSRSSVEKSASPAPPVPIAPLEAITEGTGSAGPGPDSRRSSGIPGEEDDADAPFESSVADVLGVSQPQSMSLPDARQREEGMSAQPAPSSDARADLIAPLPAVPPAAPVPASILIPEPAALASDEGKVSPVLPPLHIAPGHLAAPDAAPSSRPTLAERLAQRRALGASPAAAASLSPRASPGAQAAAPAAPSSPLARSAQPADGGAAAPQSPAAAAKIGAEDAAAAAARPEDTLKRAADLRARITERMQRLDSIRKGTTPGSTPASTPPGSPLRSRGAPAALAVPGSGAVGVEATAAGAGASDRYAALKERLARLSVTSGSSRPTSPLRVAAPSASSPRSPRASGATAAGAESVSASLRERLLARRAAQASLHPQK